MDDTDIPKNGLAHNHFDLIGIRDVPVIHTLGHINGTADFLGLWPRVMTVVIV